MSKPNRKYIGTTGLDFLGENDEEATVLRSVASAPAAAPVPISKATPPPAAPKALLAPTTEATSDKLTSESSVQPVASIAPSGPDNSAAKKMHESTKTAAKAHTAKTASPDAKLTLVSRRPSGVPSDTAGFERTTYWMDPHLKLKIQEKAYWERMQIFQVVNMIVEDYFKHHPVKQAQ